MRRPNPTEEEIRVTVDRAKSHYHDHVKHQLTEADKGRYVAIDGKSLEWEIGDTDNISEVLRARVPDAIIYQLRHIIIVSEYILSPRLVTSSNAPNLPSHQLADDGEEFGQ